MKIYVSTRSTCSPSSVLYLRNKSLESPDRVGLQRQVGVLQSWRNLKHFILQPDVNSCTILGRAVLHINRQGRHIPLYRASSDLRHEHHSYCWGNSLLYPCGEILREWCGLHISAVHDSDYNNLYVRSNHVLILRIRSSSWIRVCSTSYFCTEKPAILSTAFGLHQYICARTKSIRDSIHDWALCIN